MARMGLAVYVFNCAHEMYTLRTSSYAYLNVCTAIAAVCYNTNLSLC